MARRVTNMVVSWGAGVSRVKTGEKGNVKKVGLREQGEGGKARKASQGRQGGTSRWRGRYGEDDKKRENMSETTGLGGKEDEGEKKESRRDKKDGKTEVEQEILIEVVVWEQVMNRKFKKRGDVTWTWWKKRKD
jgi:hypothetical protein